MNVNDYGKYNFADMLISIGKSYYCIKNCKKADRPAMERLRSYVRENMLS